MIYRRQRQQYIFAGLLAVIAVVNVLFFLILNRPSQTEYRQLEESIQQLQAQVLVNKAALTKLEKTSSELKSFETDKNKLLNSHLVARGTGYSHVVMELNEMVGRSGVNKTRVGFSLDPEPKAGLNAVTITMPLEGGYTNVVNFIKALENSKTLFLITKIELVTSESVTTAAAGTPQFQPVVNATSGGGPVTLSLGLETYFYQ